MAGIVDAFKAFFAVLGGKDLVPQSELETLQAELKKLQDAPKPEPKKEEKKPDRFQEGAVFSLLLLQREGRLMDFLMENLDGFADDQIGAAVRQIHKDSAKAIKEHFAVEPIVNGAEGELVDVPEPLDATQYKLTGNVPDSGPYKGSLAHKGWKATKVKLPERTGKVNVDVIQPAEVEI